MTSTTIHNNQDGGPTSYELHGRLTTVERDLGKMGENMKSEFSEIRSESASRHNDLTSTIKELTTAQNERSRTPWPLILGGLGTAMTILSVAGTLLYQPLRERQGEIGDALKAVAEKMVTEKELTTILTATGARRDDAQRTIETRMTRTEGDIDKLQSSIVPRGEIDTMQRSLEYLSHTRR